MIKRFCDLCKKEIKDEERRPEVDNFFISEGISFEIEDICNSCYSLFSEKKEGLKKRIDQAKEEYTQKISDIVNEELKQTP
ncbi:MAG: hypothetical protein ACOC44_10015 [Promethearchaeia archaeon]